MSETVRLVSPEQIKPNPENPRIIFREDELKSLMDSISQQGILVPLTVFENGKSFVILDGERRWRCSLKLGLDVVPVIVQPKPERLQNIMMMFAIHNARKDWDPLPTALKLAELERELTERQGTLPTEKILAASASMSVGEIRRLRRILALPEANKVRLMDELQKPRHLQVLTVDHFLETMRGSQQLVKKGVINSRTADELNEALISKFERKIEKSTVAPRLLPKIARAYERQDIDKAEAVSTVKKLIRSKTYTIQQAFQDIAVTPEENRKIETAAKTLSGRLREFFRDSRWLTPEAEEELIKLKAILDKHLS